MKKKIFLLLALLIHISIFSENIKIGFIAPLTGEHSQSGVEVLNGLNLALEDNYQIEIIVKDNGGEAVSTVKIMLEFANDEEIVAITGPILDDNAKLATEIANNYKIPTIYPTSTDFLTTVSGNYGFRIPYIEEYNGVIMAEFAHYELGAKSALIIKDISSAYSVINAANFRSRMQDYNIDKVMEVFINSEYDIETKLNIINSEVIFIPNNKNLNSVLRYIRDKYPEKAILGTDRWKANFVDEYYRNIYISSHFSEEIETPMNIKFLKNYVTKYGVPATLYSAFGYDLGLVIQNIIENAQDREGIKEQLRKKLKFEGVTGIFRYDDNNNPIKSSYIKHLSQEGFQYYCKVNPDFLGSSKKIEKPLEDIMKEKKQSNKLIFQIISLILLGVVIYTIQKN